MIVSEKASMAFLDAIDTAYAITSMMALGSNEEELAVLQEKYELEERQYAAIMNEGARADWWEKRCEKEPGCAECKCFDL
jgi:hypothetical protein